MTTAAPIFGITKLNLFLSDFLSTLLSSDCRVHFCIRNTFTLPFQICFDGCAKD